MIANSNVVQWPDSENLLFRKVSRDWPFKMLLDQKGWFPLPDVMRSLDRKNTGQYRRILALREKLLKAGGEPQKLMGLKQFGSRLWAYMPSFSQWYQTSEILRVAKIPKDWDLKMFLAQTQGIFSLRGVLALMPRGWPIKYPAMKNLIIKSQNPRGELGADRLDGAGYVVFMPQFAEWIKKQVS